MAIMELKLFGDYAGQQILNVFNFLFSGTPAAVTPSFGLVAAFGGIESAGVYPTGTLFNAIRAAQVPDMHWTSIEVRDVYSVTDFYTTPFVSGTDGLGTGEGLSPALGYGFYTNRTRTDIRRGRKNFVGVAETAVGSGGVIVAGAVPTLEELAFQLSQTLTYTDEGNTLSYQPIVVSKEEYTPNPLKPERKAYKYYETEAEQLTHIMSSLTWSFKPNVRTQVSRQYGHGR